MNYQEGRSMEKRQILIEAGENATNRFAMKEH